MLARDVTEEDMEEEYVIDLDDDIRDISYKRFPMIF